MLKKKKNNNNNNNTDSMSASDSKIITGLDSTADSEISSDSEFSEYSDSEEDSNDSNDSIDSIDSSLKSSSFSPSSSSSSSGRREGKETSSVFNNLIDDEGEGLLETKKLLQFLSHETLSVGLQTGDFFSDFGTSHPYLIDGEALVAWVLNHTVTTRSKDDEEIENLKPNNNNNNNNNNNKNNLIDFSLGPQSAPVIDRLEFFINKILTSARGLKNKTEKLCSIVFFNNYDQLHWADVSQEFRFLRLICIAHLKQTCSDHVNVYCFDQFWTKDLQEAQSATPNETKDSNSQENSFLRLINSLEPSFIITDLCWGWTNRMKLLSCAFTFYCRAFYLGVVELSGIDFTATRLTSGMLEPVVYTIHQLRIILGPIITFVDKKLLGAASSSSSSSSPSKTSKQNVSTLALSLKNQYLELISDELNGFTSCRSVLSLCSLFLTVSELIGVSSDPVYQARLRFVTDLYICTLASIDGLSVQNRGFSSPVFSEFLSKRSYSDLTLLPLYDLEDGEELIDFLFDSTPFPEKPSALIKCSLEQQQQLEPLSFGKLFITQICSSASSLLSVSDDLLPAFLNLDSQTKEGPITPTVYDLLDSRFFLVLCCFVLNKSPDEFLFSNLIELFDENCQKRANLYRGFLLNLGNTLSSSSALEIKTTTLVSGFLSQDMKIKEVLLPELTANNYYNDLINDLKQTADASTQQFSSYDKLAPVKSPLLKEAFPALIEKFKPFEKDIDDKLKGAKMSFQPHHFHSPRPLDINITYDPSDYEHLESLREKEQKQRAAQTPREKALLLRKEQDREKAEIRYQDSLLHGQPITPKKIIVRNSGNSSHKEPKFEKQSIKAQKISQELEAASIKRIQAKYKEKLENLTSSLTSSQGNLSAVKSIEDLENECRREGCFEVAMSAGLKALEYHLCTIPPPTKKSNDSHSNKNNNSDGDGSDDEFLELDSLQSLAVYYIFSFTQKYTLDLIVENSSICKSLLAICKKYKLDDLVDNLKEQREKSEKNTKKALSSKSTKASVSSSTSSTSTSSTSLSSSTSSSSLSSSSSSSSSSVAPSKLVSDPDDIPCYPTFHSLFSQPIAEILPHKTSTRKDKRVEFPPDEWQIKLLDVVDKNESALIVAPTSSGKTFISYYCMEKILTQDNSSVVVYVAPTKALVNQVYSEVRARFQKTDSVVAGTFTRDFRYHQYRCQVLITVPQCLEILLLSPDKEAIAFSKKLAYVIFDEIHAVSSNTGAVWERLLVAINCPFLALSATIGQATEFHASLQRACSFKDKSSRVHLIEHKERFNDLSPLMLKSKEAPPNKFGVAENTLSTFHPLFAFQNKAMLLQNEQTLNNLAFVPEDSYKLYAACEQFCGTSAARSLSKPTRNALTELLKLEPCTYFSNDMSKCLINFTIEQARDYEKDLKKAFHKFCLEDSNAVSKIIESLSSDVTSFSKKMTRPSYDHIVCRTIEAISELKSEGKIPCLGFLFSRDGCFDIALEVFEYLEAEEEEWRNQPEQRETLKGLKNKLHRKKQNFMSQQKSPKFIEDPQQRKKELSILSNEIDACKCELVMFNRPQLQFSLFPEHVLTETDLIEAIGEYQYQKVKDLPEVQFLFRGIGVHHAGIGKKVRQLTERLFRARKLGFVVCTSTLALGINMPCSSIMLIQDSFYLNTMMFKQIIGRAGRRGLDNRGYYLPLNVPKVKLQRLMRGNLPFLRENLLLTASTVLRIAILNHFSSEKGTSVTILKRICETPLFSNPSFLASVQAQLSIRLSFEYLQSCGFIDSENTPSAMCGIASHLNFLEPANFAFSYLLASGMLESVYTETVRAQGRDSAIETLISILSYFFCPIPLTRLQRRSLKRLEGPSKLLLPPLPKRVLDEVNLHASQVKQMVENYLKCASMAYEKELSDFDTLPLSGIKSSACGSESKSGLLSEISQTASISVRLRSKYLAVNGICDSFSSLKEISMTTRQKLAFNPLFVPVLEFDPSIMYNSFLLDYYKHSNYSALSRYNGISVGDLFDLVKGFILCLRAVAAAQTVAEPDSPLTGVLVEIGAKYKKIFDEETK